MIANPQRIGPYIIDCEIGRGGMGSVFRAHRDGDFEHRVAIKILPTWMRSDDAMHRFRREQALLAALQHPNIAQIHDGGVTAEGIPYFIMEYVDGTHIDRYCDENAVGLRQRVSLLRDVALTLDYAHRNLVVHRDIKASNLLVTAEAQLKLLDFGIAKGLNPEFADLTVTHLTPLSLENAAPEQIHGKAVTPATDVYQLGVLMYRLLTGCSPYPDRPSSLMDLARMIHVEERRPPSSRPVHPALPFSPRALRGDLDAICLKALEKDVDRRYRTMFDFAEDLAAHLNGFPVSARALTPLYRSYKFVRRRPWQTGSLLAGSMLLAAYAATATVQSRRLQLALEQAQTQQQRAEQIAKFLQQAFVGQTPNQGAGAQLTGLQLLQQAEALIPQTAPDNPQLQTELYLLFARIYNRLRLSDRAEAAARAGNQLRLLHADQFTAEQLVDGHRLWAEVVTFRNRPDDALRILETVKPFAASVREPLIRARYLAAFADIHQLNMNYASAIEGYRHAVDVALTDPGNLACWEFAAMNLAALSNAYSDSGHSDLALAAVEEAAEAFAKSGSQVLVDHLRLKQMRVNRLFEAGDQQRGAAAALDLVGEIRPLVGTGDAAAAVLYEELAQVLTVSARAQTKLKQYALAESQLLEAIDLLQRFGSEVGSASEFRAQIYKLLALNYEESGQPAKARLALESGWRLFQETPQMRQIFRYRFRAVAAEIFYRQGEYADAEAAADEAIAHLADDDDARLHPQLIKLSLALMRGQLEQAEHYHAEAERFVATHPESTPSGISAALTALSAVMLEARGATEHAIQLRMAEAQNAWRALPELDSHVLLANDHLAAAGLTPLEAPASISNASNPPEY